MLLILVSAIADFAEPVNEHRPGRRGDGARPPGGCDPNASARGLDLHAGRGHPAQRVRGPPGDRCAYPLRVAGRYVGGVAGAQYRIQAWNAPEASG